MARDSISLIQMQAEVADAVKASRSKKYLTERGCIQLRMHPLSFVFYVVVPIVCDVCVATTTGSAALLPGQAKLPNTIVQ
jgi:hypothetical protein